MRLVGTLVCQMPRYTPADFPSSPHAASWRRRASASRSRSNEPPRQIEDGAHKLLRAAASCACLELACTQTSLEAGPPSTGPIACACGLLNARLATVLNWTKVPHALSGHPMLVSQQR